MFVCVFTELCYLSNIAQELLSPMRSYEVMQNMIDEDLSLLWMSGTYIHTYIHTYILPTHSNFITAYSGSTEDDIAIKIQVCLNRIGMRMYVYMLVRSYVCMYVCMYECITSENCYSIHTSYLGDYRDEQCIEVSATL